MRLFLGSVKRFSAMFKRKSATPRPDPRVDVANALAALREDLLSEPDRLATKISEFEIPEDDETGIATQEAMRRLQALKAYLGASRELIEWVSDWVELPHGWAPPLSTIPGTGAQAKNFSSALYNVTREIPKDRRFGLMVSQGLDRESWRRVLINRYLPDQIGGVSRLHEGDLRIPMAADALLRESIVRCFCERFPLWPNRQEKMRGQVLADVYGKTFYSWVGWSLERDG